MTAKPRPANLHARKLVAGFDFEKVWVRAHRAGKIHRHEAARILADDYSAIVRDLEPDFKAGQEFVLSWSRERRWVDEVNKLDPDAWIVVTLPRRELFAIRIGKTVRRVDGTWRTSFRVLYDRRDPVPYMRAKPPVLARTSGEPPPTAEEIERARLESAYTTNPRSALDLDAPAIPDDFQETLTKQAHEGRERRQSERLAVQQAAPLEVRLANVRKLAREKNVDVSSEERVIERRLAAIERKLLSDAA